MVPFARYVAMNRITSFRGYQMGKVYRRDEPSKGRYREFYQCYFDIAGDESIGADFEVVNVLTELLELNISEYEIDEKGLDTETVEKIGSFVKLKGHPFELLLELKKEGSQFLTNDSSKQALRK
nr:histidine--tRNA ligase, cytoplasmic [Tanacetum cinerariifolium]